MIRKAGVHDINAIHKLLQAFAEEGQLLPRPLSGLYDHLRDFFVYAPSTEQSLVGCCALQVCWEDLAEIRSLAVVRARWGQGIGGRLLTAALEEARTMQIKKVFTLTYRPGFFEKFGFRTIDRSALPLKIWGDCILCVKFPDCDEIAMVKEMACPAIC
jgi:amino-acid N-acetyltransferase